MMVAALFLIIGGILWAVIATSELESPIGGLVCLILGLICAWYDVTSPEQTDTTTTYIVASEFNNTVYPNEAIFSMHAHRITGERFGAMTKDRNDTTYEFIKFYEEGDLDEYRNITRF